MTANLSTPALKLDLGGTPPRIVVRRSGVDDRPWDEIAALLSDESIQRGPVMLVKPVAFLQQRLRLQGVLRRHGIAIEPEEAVRKFLQRAQADDVEFRNVLEGCGGRQDRTHDPIGRLLVDGRAFTRALRPFQERDLEKLTRLSHGANFSVPGAGKTSVAFALHHLERAAGRVDRLLVIAPLSAFGAWEEEGSAVFDPAITVARFRNGRVPQGDVVLINYQRVPNALEKLSSWMGNHAVHLVVDEAHRAKRGATGNWGRSILELATLAARRDVLTGTPAPNHPRDIRALLDILWPGGGAGNALPQDALQNEPPLSAMGDVARAIRPIYVRTTKEELQLPSITFNPIRVRLKGVQKDIYDAMLSRYQGMFTLDRGDSAMFARLGEVTMYLLQAACSPKLLSINANHSQSYRYPSLAIQPGTTIARLLEKYDDHEVPAKVARACTVVFHNAKANKKTLVWSNFPNNLLTLERQLAALQPALIYGAIPSRDEAQPGTRTREGELERFRHDPACMVLLANPAAMAEGVSLHHACHDAVYLDRTFNAGQYLQSLDRIHRLGLSPDAVTNITLLIADGTIDERVNSRVEIKTRRLAQLLSDPGLVQMALPDDDDFDEPVGDPEDLEEILRHLGEASSPDDEEGG